MNLPRDWGMLSLSGDRDLCIFHLHIHQSHAEVIPV